MHLTGETGPYSAATMLFEGAGAYVLIAIIAFMVGVIVTVMIMRNRKKADYNNTIRKENVEGRKTYETE